VPPIIEFRNVTKVFETREGAITAVDGIDLRIEQGEIFGVIGYSGAGKSTVVRLVNGLERITSGQLLIDGVDVTNFSERQFEQLRREIGMIFQQFNLFNSRTVAGNVAFPLKVAKWPKADRDRRVAELLDFVGLLDRALSYPDQLSGGQKQRVGIARALATSPKILLADESTSALDPETTRDVLRLLHQVNEELGITIVVITHELSVVRDLADRIAVLENGKVAEEGSVFDIFSAPKAGVTRRFISTVLHDRPDAEELQQIRTDYTGRIVTAQVRDGRRLGGVLASAGERNVTFEIVHGGIGRLQDRSFGSLTLALSGPDHGVDAVIAELRGITAIDEVGA
jgi:D-methionine transport system ATP-binding protein